MHEQLAKFAYNGQWADLTALLRHKPDLVNNAGPGKGYTPLHQAAWHGADLSLVGALLKAGASRNLCTTEGRNAYDIAQARHPKREELHYLLAPSRRSLSQLLRKLIAEHPALFSDYDGNQILCERLISCLSETWVPPTREETLDIIAHQTQELEARINAAVYTVTGLPLSSDGTACLQISKTISFEASMHFVQGILLPALRPLISKSDQIPLEPHWTVLADLFAPAPDQWGLRGDLFLWMELRQTLCNCALPDPTIPGWQDHIRTRLEAAILTLTGINIRTGQDILVPRYQRGGMSSGMVSSIFWHQTIVPLLTQRAGWLQHSWSCRNS